MLKHGKFRVPILVLGLGVILGFIFVQANGQKIYPSQENFPRELVHLLDYVSQDYGGAVSDGKILSRSEYQEQLEFSETALELGRRIDELKSHPEIIANLQKLGDLIKEKVPPGEISTLSQLTKDQVIKVTGLTVAPSHWPALAHGQNLFSQTCVTCHGPKGDGKGPAAMSLTPRPSNFLDPKKMSALSPFKAFNAIRLGVPGTAMAPQSQLSDKDIWDLAFYVVSVRHQNDLPRNSEEVLVDFAKLSKDFALEKTATSSDSELNSLSKEQLAILRTHSGDDDTHDSLQIAKANLAQALEEYDAGRYADAKSKALVAYLEGIEPVEPRLRASDPALTAELEGRMAMVRASIESRKPRQNVVAAIESANQEMELAGILLNQSAPSPWLTFFIAAAILLREGFEAVLIIIALLGVIRASGATHAYRWVHGGWLAALALGAVAWFLSGWLMAISGAQRELMEGVTSIAAVIVLLYMGFWLHRTTEIGRWTKFINGKVKTALEGKKLFGLAIISFMAVFREAFETVLFLRALWLEGGMSTKWAMAAGTLGSFTLILFLAWIILKYAAKIPIRQLFGFSSALMTLLAGILVGKGFHSLQETGLLSITSSPLNLRVDLLGFYPTFETTLAQGAILFFAWALWYFGKKPTKKRRPAHKN